MQNLFYNREVLTDKMIDEAWNSLKAAGMHPTWRAFQNEEITFSGYRTCFVDRLAQLKLPTLIVHGAQDRLIPVKWAKRAHQLIPNAELKIIENCGHLPPREKPREFNQLLMDFLE
jgi:pimeloyl-ACP methyl ester carboxylesterase